MNKEATGKTAEQQGQTVNTKKSETPYLDKIRTNNTLMILDAMEKGNAPWQNTEKIAAIGMPYTPDMSNGDPRQPYTGSAAITLLTATVEKGYDDPRWVDSKIIEMNNMYVKKGEKATFIEMTDYFKRDAKGKSIIGKDGKPEFLDRPNVYVKTMFNVSQLGNPVEVLLPDKMVRQGVTSEPNLELADRILKDTPVKIAHCLADGGTPRYDKFKDLVEIPRAEAFASKEEYYAEALHQLTHATGNKKRDGRGRASADTRISAGTPRDKEEELTGEIASFFLRMNTGIKLGQSHQDFSSKANAESIKSCVMKENGELFNAHLFSIAATEGWRASNNVVKMAKELEQAKEQDKPTPEHDTPFTHDVPQELQQGKESASQETTPLEVEKSKKKGRDADRGR